MPSPSASPPIPTVHTASTIRRLPPSNPLSIPRAPDGMALDRELEKCWARVKARLSVVEKAFLSHHPVRTEPVHWAGIYTDFANLYTQNDSARKRRMYVYIRDYVRDLVATQLAHLRKLDGPPLLAEYCRTWLATMKYACHLKRVLHHLHRFWIRDHANTLKIDPVRPLDKLLMFYWREDLLSKLCNIITIAMQHVAADRMGHKIDHTIVRGVVDTLVTIGQADVPSPDSLSSTTADPSGSLQTNLSLYIRLFEDEFLERTRMFYKEEGEKMVAVGDVSKFMKSVLARLAEEDERGKRLLHPDSAPRLRRATEDQLIGNHLLYLQEEAQGMIREGKEEDLKLVYTLLSSIENGLLPLRSFFMSYVRAEGNSVVMAHVEKLTGKTDNQSNLELIRVLVRLHRKHSSLVRRCFDGSSIIMMAIDDAFRGFSNRSFGSLSLPVVIAHYVDRLLRSGARFDREMWVTTENIDEQPSPCKKVDDVEFAQGSDGEVHSEIRGKTDQDEIEVQGARPSESKCKDEEGDNSKEEDIKHLTRYLTELVRIFMYLDDKDLFFETHRRLFAKRLMTYHDEDLETLFISKVKDQMGPTFTQRLSGMLQDKLVSNMTRDKFCRYLETKREQFRKFKQQHAVRNASQSSAGTLNCELDRLQQPNAAGGPDPQRPHIPVSSDFVDISGPSHGNGAVTEGLNSGTEHENNVSLLADAANMEALKLSNPAAPQSAGEDNSKDGDGKDTLQEETNDNVVIKGIDDMDVLEETLQIEFSAHVLNSLHWPAAKVADLSLPPALNACHRMFSDFYMANRETRKLSWIHNLSTVTMTASLGGRDYLLSMSAFQAAALILFNERDSISVGAACTALNISKDELVEHIKPLFLSRKCRMLKLERSEETVMEDNGSSEDNPNGDKARDPGNGSNKRALGGNIVDMGNGKRRRTDVVIERPEGNAGNKAQEERRSVEKECGSGSAGDEIADSGRTNRSAAKDFNEGRRGAPNGDGDIMIHAQDILRLNTGFQSRACRIWVPTSIAKIEGAEVAASKRSVVVDRSTQVDAALVRIMKSRREMTHADLSAEVISTLAPMFEPDIRLIKSRLERLIDQEYVERDKNDPKLYRYSA
eukprot:GFKZ01007169.1.p1 GENE.GFKZ01007169.1~~GFKZ01007169.1.p1  ORF type:complete len:1106 (+),score=181.62 GFKZ01007169.1:299-3616(+)